MEQLTDEGHEKEKLLRELDEAKKVHTHTHTHTYTQNYNTHLFI